MHKLFSKSSLDIDSPDIDYLQKLLALGIRLNVGTGHISYTTSFKPLQPNFNLVFVRHGETYGNCGQATPDGKIDSALVKLGLKNPEKRIFQGNVDTEINQLTEYGKQQAAAAAEKLTHELIDKEWIPDVILSSPLRRAQDTALPFVTQHRFADRFFTDEGITEMSFGAWDNRRVDCMAPDDQCHAFYREQQTLVKQSGINADGTYQESENFCDVLLRAHKVLTELSEKHAGKNVLMFSHSMFGAACLILCGKGQLIENGDYLAFDGKRFSDGSYYTMPHAEPFFVNFKLSLQKVLAQ